MQLGAVLIIDDDVAMHARLSRVLAETVTSPLHIDTADTLQQARALAARTPPYSLALVDVQLPDGNGIDFIDWLQTHAPATPAVIVSSWAEEGTLLAALRKGATGYLLKNAEDIELTMQLRSLQRGGAPIDPVIARRLLALMPQAAAAETAPETHLSPRETEILQLVARGLSNREIATVTALSKLTIESHVRNIYRKLAVGSRTAAVFEAQALGLLH